MVEFKKWINKYHHWEDPDCFQIGSTQNGIFITDVSGLVYAEGSDLQTACEDYDKQFNKKYGERSKQTRAREKEAQEEKIKEV